MTTGSLRSAAEQLVEALSRGAQLAGEGDDWRSRFWDDVWKAKANVRAALAVPQEGEKPTLKAVVEAFPWLAAAVEARVRTHVLDQSPKYRVVYDERGQPWLWRGTPTDTAGSDGVTWETVGSLPIEVYGGSVPPESAGEPLKCLTCGDDQVGICSPSHVEWSCGHFWLRGSSPQPGAGEGT